MTVESMEQKSEVFKRMVAFVGKRLEPDADWKPMLLLERDGDPLTILGIDPSWMQDGGRKDLLASAIAQLIRSKEAEAAALVMSMWRLKIDRPIADMPLPSESPDREEIVILYVARPGEVATYAAEIKRRPGRPPKLGPWLGASDAAGRFIDALSEAWS